MYKIVSLLVFMLISGSVLSNGNYKKIKISEDLEILQLSDNSFVHVSYAVLPGYGRYGSNGFIYLNDNEAFLFDTPVNDELTEKLIKWIRKSLKAEITGFVPNHWHDDCMGGINYLISQNIRTYGNVRTISIAKSKNLTAPKTGFEKEIKLKVGNETVVCKYYGAAHSMDNIVTWIPSEKVLFAGCMVKDLNSKTPGNLSDADVAEWPKTIDKVIADYSQAKTVIPGHGAIGGVDLLLHTRQLLRDNK